MPSTATRKPVPAASSFEVAPINPQRIFQEVATQLRRLISEGKLRTGDKLPPERELAKRFGVSRNTMREALRALELSGLIELRLGATGGAFVLPGSSNAVVAGMRDLYFLGAITPQHLTEARIAVSAAVIRVACERITDEEIEALEANVAAAERARQQGDFEERTRHHQAFHVMLARTTHNPVLIATTEGIMEITRQFVKAIGPTDEQTYTHPSRKRLLKHLRARDTEKAVAEMGSALTKLHRSYMVKADAPPAARAANAPAPPPPPPGPRPAKARPRALGAA
ncbi:GntR family transcriptional regulator [Xenophilus arseniciresistens]|uniref:GntR family transcriptional regulator n=1 Tax=Xenophilus arseniciresistens TaxID=1283306 RepID=A0AAE3T1V1_9BURK|nr:FCD domain-containing protein [Xenophilus arseniciresistens]MDA7419000.1 GntR family transcriptional regulator [Xenophilus arseniciresistens]